jgi:hypothetical protein
MSPETTARIIESNVRLEKASEITGIPMKTLRHWRLQRHIPQLTQLFSKIGGIVLFDLGRYARLIETQREKALEAAHRMSRGMRSGFIATDLVGWIGPIAILLIMAVVLLGITPR